MYFLELTYEDGCRILIHIKHTVHMQCLLDYQQEK